ncbi:MAG: 4'-phosphopantetheinyl transferase superfamily protein [Arenimonas sp.]
MYSATAGPAPPWPKLDEANARHLPDDELRLLWLPSEQPGTEAIPRRERLDALLRGALAPVLGLPPGELRFDREHKGRPFLRHERAPDFNLSDTTGGTLLAMTRAARVGVDLELRERAPPAARLAARYFDPLESLALAQLPAAAAAREFILLWTAKEASCKATGTGIFGFLPRWCFEPGHEQPQLRALPAEAGEARRWRFLRVAPSPAHTAVLALRDAAPALRLRAFSLG